jgi:hypothetical protein
MQAWRERQNGERDEVELKLPRNRADQPSHRSAGAALSSSTSWPLEYMYILQDWYYSLVIDYNTEGSHGACLHMGSLHHLQYYYFQQPAQISHVRPPRDNMNSKTPPPGPEPTYIAPRRTEPCDRAVYLGISDTLSTPGPFRRARVRPKDPLKMSMNAPLQYKGTIPEEVLRRHFETAGEMALVVAVYMGYRNAASSAQYSCCSFHTGFFHKCLAHGNLQSRSRQQLVVYGR